MLSSAIKGTPPVVTHLKMGRCIRRPSDGSIDFDRVQECRPSEYGARPQVFPDQVYRTPKAAQELVGGLNPKSKTDAACTTVRRGSDLPVW